MPFALIVIGIVLFATALNGTYRQFGSQLYSDMFGQNGGGGFVYWVLALVVVGLIGYVPQLKKPADWFMFLIIIGIVLANGGFFQKLQQAIQSGPGTLPSGNPSTSSGQASPSTGLFSGPLGSILINQQAQLGNEPLTTVAPSSSVFGTVPLGQGGIGAA